MKIIDDILYEMQEYLNQEVIDTGKETISDVGVGIECCMEIAKRIANEQDNGWIPCSERLPEVKEKRFGNKQKRTEVLVTLRNGLVKEMTFEFATKEFWEAGDENPIEHWKEDANDSGCEVIAWQPLPEPYKESEKE